MRYGHLALQRKRRWKGRSEPEGAGPTCCPPRLEIHTSNDPSVLQRPGAGAVAGHFIQAHVSEGWTSREVRNPPAQVRDPPAQVRNPSAGTLQGRSATRHPRADVCDLPSNDLRARMGPGATHCRSPATHASSSATDASTSRTHARKPWRAVAPDVRGRRDLALVRRTSATHASRSARDPSTSRTHA